MATLRQYFDTDFTRVLSVHQTCETQGSNKNISVILRKHLDFDANANYLSCFIPECDNPASLCRAFIDQIEDLLDVGTGLLVQMGNVDHDERTDSHELRFTGRIFVYTETAIASDDCQALIELASTQGLVLRIRGPEFAMRRAKGEKPMAFISHDSRDKDTIARPIAIRLSQLVCPVWFDEFSLKVGDSLRESIEKGLKESKKCILVLSPRFLSNPGWTKVEFNSIFTREILEGKNLVLPVWHEVTKEEVFEYCPSLLDRLGTKWSLGQDEVIRQLHRAIMRSEV
jgi:hypothetical protein